MKPKDKRVLNDHGFRQGHPDTEAAECAKCGVKIKGTRGWWDVVTFIGHDEDVIGYCGTCARFICELRSRK